MDGFAEGGLLGGHLRPRLDWCRNGSGTVELVLTPEQWTALKAKAAESILSADIATTPDPED